MNQEKKIKIIFSFVIFLLIILAGMNLFFIYKQEATVHRLYEFLLGGLIFLIPVILVVCFFVFKEHALKTLFAISMLTMLITGFENLRNSNILSNNISLFQTVPDFTGKTVEDVKKFISKNKIEIELIEDYSEAFDEGIIFDQNPKGDILASSIKKMTIYISIGRNPDKIIFLPENVMEYDVDAFIKFVEENHLSNVIVQFEKSDEVERNKIISLSRNGKMKRSEEIVVVFSLGNAELGNVPAENFTKLSMFKIDVWLKQHGVPYTIEYEYSDTVPPGQIIRQTPDVGQEVGPEKPVVIFISKGVPIVVPDFSGMNQLDINEWGRKNIVYIVYEEAYDDAEVGKVIGQSLPTGEKIDQKTSITITLSKGPLVIPNFTTLSALNGWANANGIYVNTTYENNDSLASGTLIRYTPGSGNSIKTGGTIQAIVSRGKSISVPNFVGKHVDTIRSECQALGLSCSFYRGGFSQSAYDHALSQSVGAGSVVNIGTAVSISLSDGQPQTFTVTYSGGLINSGDVQTTINALSAHFSANYPGVNFNFVTQKSDIPGVKGIVAENSPIKNGSVVTQGQTYTVIIYE